MAAFKTTKSFLTGLLLVILVQGCFSEEKTKKPPKIVTKDGNLVLKAGEDGDIVLEPADGRQVRIGSFVLSENSTTTTVQGQKGEKGDPGNNGQKGTKGDWGSRGYPGHHGIPGVKGNKGNRGTPGQHGQKGDQGRKGTMGLKGDQGIQGTTGPPGPKGDSHNVTSGKDCQGPNDYGLMNYVDESVKVCTPEGWKTLAYKSDIDICKPSVPKTNLKHFKSAGYGVLFQFNGDMKIYFSPNTTSDKRNITTMYQNSGSNSSNPEYVNAVMGKAIRLTGRQNVDLKGLPLHLWSAKEWSVMALVKLNKQGLNARQIVAVIGSGVMKDNKGFHLGIIQQKVYHGFYRNDFSGSTSLEYDRWYEITWTWKATGKLGTRKIFVNGVLDGTDANALTYTGNSLNTEIGAWWDDNTITNNIQIDTLYIIDSVVNYKADESLVICEGKAVANEMP